MVTHPYVIEKKSHRKSPTVYIPAALSPQPEKGLVWGNKSGLDVKWMTSAMAPIIWHAVTHHKQACDV